MKAETAFHPLSFIVFKGFFIASMAISTAIMGCLALVIMAVKGGSQRYSCEKGFFGDLSIVSRSVGSTLYSLPIGGNILR
jgi:hypothetical protein